MCNPPNTIPYPYYDKFPLVVSVFGSCPSTPVLLVGLEPTWHLCRGIFVLLYVTIATFLCCSLEHVFTISYSDLGSWCMSSTHLFFKIFLFQRNLARRSVFAFAVLANFYSKSFLLGTLCNCLQSLSLGRTHQSPLCIPFHHRSIFNCNKLY